MERTELQNAIAALAEGLEFPENTSLPEVIVQGPALHDFCKKLKNDPQLAFDYLISLTAVDYPNNITIVYHLYATDKKHYIVVKTRTADRVKPNVDTVSDIWTTAEFQEREVFDLFGVTFNHHPDPRRLLLPDDWQGYPLRKDYKDEVNIIER